MSECVFPHCGHDATARNRAHQSVCGYHVPVVIGITDDLGMHGKHCDETGDFQ